MSDPVRPDASMPASPAEDNYPPPDRVALESARADGEAEIPVLKDVVVQDRVSTLPAMPPLDPPQLEALAVRITGHMQRIISVQIAHATHRILTEIRALRGLPAAAPASASAHTGSIARNPPEAITMDKTYDPKDIEQHWYDTWESRGYFVPQGCGSAYCIMLPPPNITGSLHMGHAFQDTLMDCLIRYHRMRGRSTLWQCGTDHAGIATQMVVERQMAKQGRTRQEMGREAFTQAVWSWKERSGDTITRQLRRLGAAMDWSRERFTLDPGLSATVTEVFVRLYEDGLIYRGQRLVNWDPVLLTALSDLEVIATEEQGHLWHIRYPLARAEGHLVVATTRPETMLGDVAVAVHPEDVRFQSYIGQEVQLPLTGRNIPVIGDPYVDKEFGSGCLKITPAHDFNDYEVGVRHKLPLISIFTKRALLNAEAPPAYRGLDRFEARTRIVHDLEQQGLLERVEDYKHAVPRGDRSNAVLEPYLTDQWFVRVAPLAEPAIRAVEEGAVRFVPDVWAKTYFEWMRNIKDWCISRQLWWGHRIPAWYDDQGHAYVGRTEAEARARHGIPDGQALAQDPDVLDTWFSSALWPFSTLGWPEETDELRRFYPTDALVTGFDIIFFWVARMIMMGLKFTQQVPFKEVYIHGLVRDADGDKMSKSKGNILDPLDLIDGIELDALVAKRTTGLMQPADAANIERATRKQFPRGIGAYGADALRFTFAALATQGRDIRFDLGRIEGYRNFCNKLWNAARYVLLATGGKAAVSTEGAYDNDLGERWIRSRLLHAQQAAIEAFRTYRFDLAAQAIYEFTWDEYCDWYLEWSKAALNHATDERVRRGCLRTLVEVLETLLRLAHPIIPFVTEEIWQRVAPLAGVSGDSILLQAYPAPGAFEIDTAAVEEFNWVRSFVLAVRRVRAEMDIAPGKPLAVLTEHGSGAEHQWLENNRLFIMHLGHISSLQTLTGTPSADMAAALAGGLSLFIPLAGLIDCEAELRRLNAEVEKLEHDCTRATQKLENQEFLERAPSAVVAKEQQRCEELTRALTRLREQRKRVESLR